MVVHGVPVVVVAGGKVVLEDGKLQVTQGAGRFVPTPGNNPTIYDRVRQRERVSGCTLQSTACFMMKPFYEMDLLLLLVV